MEGSESSEDRVPMLDKAAVIVAAGDRETLRQEQMKTWIQKALSQRVSIIPAVILAMAAFMAMLGSARGSTLVLRLAGMGIPALAHMAAALALAISSNWSLSEEATRSHSSCHVNHPSFTFAAHSCSCRFM